jgi:hypothetical protein
MNQIVMFPLNKLSAMYPVSQKALPTTRQAVADCYTRLIVGSLIILFKSIIIPEKLFRNYGTSEILSVVSLKVIMCTSCGNAQPVGVRCTDFYSGHDMQILFLYVDMSVCRKLCRCICGELMAWLYTSSTNEKAGSA